MKEKHDIVLVNPPTRILSRNIPYAILSLVSYLESKGKKCKIIDIKPGYIKNHDTGNVEEYVVNKILDVDSDFVGFTCLSAEYSVVYSMAKLLREKKYSGIVVAGGHHPTFCPEDFLNQEKIFDYVVLGEGEVTLYQLMEAKGQAEDKVENIDGIAFFKNGKVNRTLPRELMQDLTFLSHIPYHLLDLDYYLYPRTDLIRNVLLSGIGIVTTRGCPFNCVFCGNNALWSTNRYKTRLRVRPIADVVREIILLKDKYKIDAFYVEDDTFTLNNQRIDEFCDSIIRSNLDIVWGCQSHVNIFTDHMAERMKEAGCIQVEFGVESGSERILKEMKKGTSVEKIKKAFKICEKYKLRSLANFMLNTPTEEESDLKATLSLADEIKATKYAFAVTVPLLGTELYDRYVHPRLGKDEYKICGDRRAYQEIVDPRFRLAKHKRNIGWLYVMVRARYMMVSEYLDFLFWYLSHSNFYKKSHRYNMYRYELFVIYPRKIFSLLNSIMKRILVKSRFVG